MNTERLILAGEGWGFIAAYKGLVDFFETIELMTRDPDIGKAKRENDKYIDTFFDTETSMVVCAGYKPIVTKDLLEKKKFINIHYSLLPKYRGFHSTIWAILNGEKEFGLTVHEMNEFIDDGDTIYQYKVEDDGIRTSRDYMVLFNRKVEEVLGNVMLQYISGKIIPKKQDKRKATWVGKRNVDDCRLDFNLSHEMIKRFSRALVLPYPLPFIEYKGKSYSITKYKLHYSNCFTHVGRILNIDTDGAWIKTKDGYIVVEEILDENGAKLDPRKLFKIGVRL